MPEQIALRQGKRKSPHTRKQQDMPTNRKPTPRKNAHPTARPSVKNEHRAKPSRSTQAARGNDRDAGARSRRADPERTGRQPADLAAERAAQRARARREERARNQADRTGGRKPDLQGKPRPSLAQAEEDRFESVTLDVEGKKVTLTRRHFLYGAIGAGAAAIMAAGAVVSDEREAKGNAGIQVDEKAVAQLDDFEETPQSEHLTLAASYDLPYGSLVWSNSDEIACCLIPTATADPLTQVAVMMLATGELHTILENPMGASEGFQILDARASMHGAVWVEAETMGGRWRVYCAPMTQAASLGDARIVDEGDASFQIPSIAATGDCVWWQLTPPASDPAAAERQSYLKRARFAGGSGADIHSFTGRAACPICACRDGVAASARNPDFNRAFDLLKFGNGGTEPQDKLTLPSGMAPCALGWGPNGFSFCFEGIYDYGGGISNLGTYTPIRPHKPGQGYDGLQWFRFGRTPSTGPFWCGGQYLVKSTRSVCGVQAEKGTYCILDVESGCAGWGDHLCSSGEGGLAVTAMQIGEEGSGRTLVRIWSPND